MKHSPPESSDPFLALSDSEREEFIIYRPEEITNEEWEAWKDELRAGFGEDPSASDEEAPTSIAPF